jgi:DNA-binding GntR family transcriptional regulator
MSMPAQSKSARSYDLLKQRITDGTYGPGYRIVLDQVATELGVSAIPIREALRRLEAEGYVEVTRNVGAHVSRFDATQYVHTMHILAMLEGYATSITAPLLSAGDIARARAINVRIAEAGPDFDPRVFSALNYDFHFAIYQHCPDAHLRELIQVEWDRMALIRRASFQLTQQRFRHSVAEHDAILDLIETGAPAAEIERVARQHKIHTVDSLATQNAAIGRAHHEIPH